MDKKVNILKTRPFLTIFLSTLLFSICSYHFFTRVSLLKKLSYFKETTPLFSRFQIEHQIESAYSNKVSIDLELLIGLLALMLLISLGKEAKHFLVNLTQEPKKYFLIICILVSAVGGFIINISNIVEISFFIILFFSIYLIFLNRDSDLVNLVTNLVICSGVFMSIGVLIGLFESFFLSSELFHFMSDDYNLITDQRHIYQGFGFNHNYSAYIILIAQSFLFLSKSILPRKLKNYLTLLFTLALLITGARIVVLFFALIICNYLLKTRTHKYLIGTILIALFLMFSHIVINVHGNYELGSGPHYRGLLFSIGNIDFILANHGHLKLVYFTELKENFFFPRNLLEISKSLKSDPHSLITTLIIMGGVPLLLSVVIFIGSGIFKNFTLIERKYSSFYCIGLISVLIESIMWDAATSIFFWIICLHAITISETYNQNELDQ